MVKLEKHIKEEKYMFTLTEEIKKQIEDSYNYYHELYAKKEDPNDKYYYCGKCSAIEEILSIMGYKTKIKCGVVAREEE